MYLDGHDRMQRDMDITKVLRRIRYHDIALKSSILNTNEKMFHARHAFQNIINTEEGLMSDTDSDTGRKKKNQGKVPDA